METILDQLKINQKKTVKSLIFQAKKEGNVVGLYEQKRLMDNIAPSGNFVLTCGKSGYFAQTDIGGTKTNIGQFLAYQFIECNIGIEDFEYDEEKEVLRNKSSDIKKAQLDEVVVKVEIKMNKNTKTLY